MKQHQTPTITPRDRLLRAWQNTTELVRDFEVYAKEIDDDAEAAALFAQFAEQQGKQAAALLALLLSREDGSA